jgi:tetratricopeptide (TPR) repeat protein
MQTKLTRFALGLATAGLAASSFAQIKWAANYQEALSQAKASNKLVMVEFYTAWDPNGKRLDSDTFSKADVVALTKKLVPVRVNVEKEGVDLGKKFHITNYPTVLFVNSEQKDVGTIDGYESDSEFVKHVNTFIQDAANEPKLLAKYKSNPKDLDAITGLGTIEANRYHIAAALAKLSEAEAMDAKNSKGKMSDLENAIGDYYQNGRQFEKAIAHFKKVGDTSNVTDKKAYALLSIATCYMTMDQPEDPASDARPDFPKILEHFKAALPYLKQTLTLPKLKAEDRKIATDDIKGVDDGMKNIQRIIDAGGGQN